MYANNLKLILAINKNEAIPKNLSYAINQRRKLKKILVMNKNHLTNSIIKKNQLFRKSINLLINKIKLIPVKLKKTLVKNKKHVTKKKYHKR